ncbi:excalibur calcium-binding domain-containing protein [Prauserella oleivorans]
MSIAEEATSEISAVAFQDLNCSDFEYQEDAQAELERDPSDPHDLDGDPEDGVACEGLPSRGAQPTTPTTPAPPPAETTEPAPQPAPVEQTTTEPAFSDKNCADFATQAQAQATLDADPSDPHNLDADNDGEACERHFAGTSGDHDQQVSVYPSGESTPAAGRTTTRACSRSVVWCWSVPVPRSSSGGVPRVVSRRE